MFEDINFSYPELSWTGLTKKEIKTCINSDFNPLLDRINHEKENPGLREIYLMSHCPEYIYFSCKVLLNIDITPMQACILYNLWNHPFPMLIGSRGLSKSFSLACYAILRASLLQGTTIVCVGAAFRQSKVLHAYVQKIWDNSPILKSIFRDKDDGTRNHNDQIEFKLGKSKIIFIPLGDGEKIRGLRANIVIADEMNSLNTDVYEIVVNNFASVSMDPVKTMQRKAKIKALQLEGLEVPEELIEAGFENQSVIAGTMGFEFQPMYSYWKKYKNIIESKGDSLAVNDSDLNYKDFCIMRLPYELIPEGFMDDKTIARAKATIHIGAYNSEYGCVSVKDTTGFFKRSLIETCVATEENIKKEGWPDWCPQEFDAMIAGNKDKRYVMGIDPASDEDSFAIVILEVHDEHQRIVYSWTTNREKVKKINKSLNYYTYCSRHIRDLMKKFNIETIGIDMQGGGRPLCEELHDKDKLRKGEVPLWPEIDRSKPKDTDKMAGLHIIRPIQFANAKWTSKANHNLRKDFEGKTILFPRYDSIILGLTSEDVFGGEEMESCILNIEELKTELGNIIMTSTSNREKWDTPQVKTGSHKVGRLRKDRYSALVIANDVARDINHTIKSNVNRDYKSKRVGNSSGNKKKKENAYYGMDQKTAKQVESFRFGLINRN